jgi:hypothetical protein
VRIWGLEDRWKETDKIRWRFLKKVLRLPRLVANGLAELGIGRDSTRGKVMYLAVKYWLRIFR